MAPPPPQDVRLLSHGQCSQEPPPVFNLGAARFFSQLSTSCDMPKAACDVPTCAFPVLIYAPASQRPWKEDTHPSFAQFSHAAPGTHPKPGKQTRACKPDGASTQRGSSWLISFRCLSLNSTATHSKRRCVADPPPPRRNGVVCFRRLPIAELDSILSPIGRRAACGHDGSCGHDRSGTTDLAGTTDLIARWVAACVPHRVRHIVCSMCAASRAVPEGPAKGAGFSRVRDPQECDRSSRVRSILKSEILKSAGSSRVRSSRVRSLRVRDPQGGGN